MRFISRTTTSIDCENTAPTTKFKQQIVHFQGGKTSAGQNQNINYNYTLKSF
ncbi:hypothetical protein LguiA_033974 [Lonicera macranthoides]